MDGLNLEFSNEFDILYNNIMSNQAPGLNEYEKSLFLTQAQETIVKSIYDGKLNGNSFESTEEVSDYISPLVKQKVYHINDIENVEEGDKISKDSIFFKLPEDLWFITYESAILRDPRLGCKDGSEVIVKPVTQDIYYQISNNPFKGANDRKILRLLKDNSAELISKYNVESYLVRYLARPEPIILEDLSEYGVTIRGNTEPNECKLNSAIHKDILASAVMLAKTLWEDNKPQQQQ